VLGRVFEIDKKKYNDMEKGAQESQDSSEDAKKRPYSYHRQYLEPRSEVEVVARQLEKNLEFRSESTGGDGDYLVPNVSPGVLEFKLHYQGKDYPVAQRLGAKVNMPFVAELCFVLDEEDGIAWMVAAGTRRSPDAPRWVPEECQSRLGACLSMITDEDDFREGLLLLFAGGGAAATGIGIAVTNEDNVSPVGPQP
jgi:hypothetical protein